MRVTTNSDRKVVEEIREKLKANDGYCPCRLKKTPETKCMCKEFRDMMENGENGMCHCGLYIVNHDA